MALCPLEYISTASSFNTLGETIRAATDRQNLEDRDYYLDHDPAHVDFKVSPLKLYLFIIFIIHRGAIARDLRLTIEPCSGRIQSRRCCRLGFRGWEMVNLVKQVGLRMMMPSMYTSTHLLKASQIHSS
jgi:hypothetical protein